MINVLKWIGLTLFTVFVLTQFALSHGEGINAIWLLSVTLLTLFIGYRFYSQYIACHVLQLNPNTRTPAERLNDGLDYVPTNKYFLFGHHFAAIAGAGPLVGPILAAQMGYLPGTVWILVGVVLGGAVQDFIILVISMRHDGKSLGDLIRSELGIIPGLITSFSILMIMVILIAVLALIVVKALTWSPWSFFTVAATIPLALLMGIYLRFLRPGSVLEVSILGVIGLISIIFLGRVIATHGTLAPYFTLTSLQLMWCLTIYGFIAAALPVWLLLAPRDYLSTFLKIGTIVGLAIAIVMVAPIIKMPPVTSFINGNGPIWSGSLFPFLFITIACGSISGFHALIASGTTPKMIENENHTRFIGYGAMLLEAFVAMMALITACCLEPGVYYAINSPAALISTSVEGAAHTISGWGFALTPSMITDLAKQIGETSILSRTGGAPTLAIGMASIFAQLFNNPALLAFWYHFAILFEAIFILTAIDAGTRVGRFVLQDFLGNFYKPLKETSSLFANLLATFLCVGAWGYFLYQGVIDPLGGINTLWPLFGIANQMLAGMALILACVYLVKTNRFNYVWVTLLPAVWLFICTMTAAWQKVFHPLPNIGFSAHAEKYSKAYDSGIIIAPAQTLNEMKQIIFNDHINTALVSLFAFVLVFLFGWGLMLVIKIKLQKVPANSDEVVKSYDH